MARYQIDNRPCTIDTQATDQVKRVIQNCKNLLMTVQGEVPYDRMRGFDSTLLSLNIHALESVLLKELDRVMLWEPDAEVVGASCTMDEHGEIYILATIEIDLEEATHGQQ